MRLVTLLWQPLPREEPLRPRYEVLRARREYAIVLLLWLRPLLLLRTESRCTRYEILRAVGKRRAAMPLLWLLLLCEEPRLPRNEVLRAVLTPLVPLHVAEGIENAGPDPRRAQPPMPPSHAGPFVPPTR